MVGDGVVSVCIPAYKAEAFIDLALSSPRPEGTLPLEYSHHGSAG